jgi:predicted Holliday junction resolvase-like endonuclease
MSGTQMMALILASAAAIFFAILYVVARVRMAAIVRNERADAVQRSRAVTVGNFTQHIVPYLPEFDFDPRDVRFLGSPIDFVVFDGLAEGMVKRIVLVEVKTGGSVLSARERSVRAAARAGRIEWREFRTAVPTS